MVAFPVYGVNTRSCAADDLKTHKLPLSLHDMLDGARQTQSTSPTRLQASHQHDRLSGDSQEDEAGPSAKKSFQPYHSRSVPKSENLEAHASERVANGVPITTMMLRNIPNKYTQNSLLREIDETGFAGTYDFFYLPMDVHNRSNVGYAFINFETPKDAERFRLSFSDHRFQRFHSRKIGSVCVAHVQGLTANLHHFENRAVTQARNDQYRPIVLQGQQRLDFDRAVALAKAKELPLPQAQAEAPAPAPLGKPAPTRHAESAASTPSLSGAHPREELEAAIRGLLSPQVGCHGLGDEMHIPSQEMHFPQPNLLNTGVDIGQEGDDIAQLLSLRSLLISQLHTHKDSPAYIHPCSFSAAKEGQEHLLRCPLVLDQ